MLTPLLQICPVLDRRRKLLGGNSCAVPVNSTSAGFSLSTAGLFLYAGTYVLADDIGIPTTPGKQPAADAAHPREDHACLVTGGCGASTSCGHPLASTLSFALQGTICWSVRWRLPSWARTQSATPPPVSSQWWPRPRRRLHRRRHRCLDRTASHTAVT